MGMENEEQHQPHWRIDPMTQLMEQVKNLAEKVEGLGRMIQEHDKYDRQSYVTRKEFEPVRRIVYGIILIITGSVLTAMLAQVLKK